MRPPFRIIAKMKLDNGLPPAKTTAETDHFVTMNTLATRMIWARVQKRTKDQLEFTQSDLATLAGVSQGAIGHLESGRTATSRKLEKIADVLGVNARWLADGKGFPCIGQEITEKTHVQRVNEDEAALLDLYRCTDGEGRDAIMKTAQLTEQDGVKHLSAPRLQGD
jgi:transcriptional regulator with XRE-family HTH domain